MSAARPAPGAGGVDPGASQALVTAYERSVSAPDRRAGGVHYTPPALARFLVETAIAALGRVPRTICDPTCGAGSFLLAAADALADRGVGPTEIVERRLVGGELDPAAAAVARAALERWAQDRGARRGAGSAGGAPRARVDVADTLLRGPYDWAARPHDGFDLVVGNPPFLSQLASPTARRADVRQAVRERFGEVGAYADSAALFLWGSLDLVGPGGVVVMLQPQSFLAARDTAAVRAALMSRAALTDVWSCDEQPFEASVHVCAPVLVRHRSSRTSSSAGSVRVHWGAATSTTAPAPPTLEPAPLAGDPWGPLFATAVGLPGVRAHGGARVGTLASATAGFRDEFYALLDASVDVDVPSDRSDPSGRRGSAAGQGSPADDQAGWPPLVTVGMIDPGRCTWGERPRRFGGRSQLAPRLDLAALAANAPRVATWAAARRVPKVLVATQTRIVEAVADPTGEWVPVTPTISVEPLTRLTTAPTDLVWRLTAALLAPPVAARALATHLGAGLSPGALRWSARSVLEVELPSDEVAWARGAGLARRLAEASPRDRAGLLDELGSVMCVAHGLAPDDDVHAWWLDRAVRAGA